MILCAFPKDKKNLFGTVSCGTCMEVEPLYNIRLPFDSDREYITKIWIQIWLLPAYSTTTTFLLNPCQLY